MSIFFKHTKSEIEQKLTDIVGEVFNLDEKAARPLMLALYEEIREKVLGELINHIGGCNYPIWSIDYFIDKVEFACINCELNGSFDYDPFLNEGKNEAE